MAPVVVIYVQNADGHGRISSYLQKSFISTFSAGNHLCKSQRFTGEQMSLAAIVSSASDLKINIRKEEVCNLGHVGQHRHTAM